MSEAALSAQKQQEILGCVLPPVEIAPFSYQYGSRYLAATYCGFDAPPSEIPGEWQHGWQPDYMNWHPEGIVGFDGLSRHHRKTAWQFVARKDQEEALKNFGYQNVAAIGHPLIYLDPPPVERLANSLLVMPVHSIATTEHHWNFDEYADTIQNIAGEFSQILVCVSPSCLEKGYWVDAFRSRGFPVVSGASFQDKNAYHRISILLKRFEFITTNGFGSHLAYAQYFGAKTSIFGPWPLYRKDDYSNTPFYQRCPELLDFNLSKLKGQRVRDEWPWLFTHPSEGISEPEWASFQLGLEMKRQPQELKQLFQWDIQPVQQSIQNKIQSTVKKLLNKTSRAIHRIAEPNIHKRDKKLAQLQGGMLKKVILDETCYNISNGSQAAREYKIYHQNKSAQILTNPHDYPMIDLVPGDGIALKYFILSFPDRPIYSVASRSIINTLLGSKTEIKNPKTNIHALSISSELNRNDSEKCCHIIDSFKAIAFKNPKERTILEHTGVIRCRLCPNCFSGFFEYCRTLPRLSLLIIEYRETQQPSLNSLCRCLDELDFAIQTHSIHFSAKWQNADTDANLTYLSALRLGDAQRSCFHSLSLNKS